MAGSVRVWVMACAVLAACDAAVDNTPRASISGGPQLEAPAPEAEPARRFQPESDAARAATGALTVTITARMPESGAELSGEVLTLRAANGLVLEADLAGTVSPSVQIDGQPVRALAEIPVEVGQALLYRIQQVGGGASLCGAGEATHIVFWESTAPGAQALRLLPLRGAPSDADATACTALSYTRIEAG